MDRQLSKAIIKRASSLGFTQPYVANLDEFEQTHAKRLKDYTDKGYHGTMSWMLETLTRRKHPQSLWKEAKSAVIFGLNYGPDTDPLIALEDKSIGNISVYARNRDYHDIMKGRLKEIAGLIARDSGTDVKVFVDTAPLMEKPLAQLAGLGWQGKHTNLVSRVHGSWFFIGTILTAAKIISSKVEVDHCGSCSACLDICPTQAFPAPYKLDARRCISYLTIEHKGIVELELREKMGNRIYGCDDCLAVCPWNKFASKANEIKLKARDDLVSPNLLDLSNLDEQTFRSHFSGSPIKRIGRDQFIRNVLYAIGNSHDPALLPSAQDHLNATNPVIRNAAEWACKKLESSI